MAILTYASVVNPDTPNMSIRAIIVTDSKDIISNRVHMFDKVFWVAELETADDCIKATLICDEWITNDFISKVFDAVGTKVEFIARKQENRD